MTGLNEIDGYVAGVQNGSINTCKFVKQAVERHVKDLERADIYFSAKHAEAFYKFCSNLRHYEGKWAGKPLILEPWQKFVFGSIFGWIEKKTGLRRFREVYIEIPKKNGKSFLGAVIALYMITWDGEAAAQAYGAATSLVQAKALSFYAAQRIIEQDPVLEDTFGVYRGVGYERISNGNNFFRPITAKPKSLDGFNVHLGLFDEVKDNETDELYNIINDGTVAREQPLTVSITTAGHNQESLGYQLRNHLIKVLDRTIEDDRFFGIIYTIDEGDEDRWDKIDVWEKANPNFGISVNPSYFENQITKAAQTQTKKNDFLTKHLNVWVKSSSAWLDMDRWNRSHTTKCKIEDFKGMPALMAVDLASVSDMCSVYIMFVRNGRFYVFGHSFLPQSVFTNRPTKYQLLYRAWEQQGLLTITPGEYTDYDFIYEYIIGLIKAHRVIAVGFDPHQAAEMMGKLEKIKIEVIEIRMTAMNFSQPMQDVERYAGLKKIEHSNDGLLKWSLSNIAVKHDRRGNIYPTKENNSKKIDAGVVLIMLFALHRQFPISGTKKKRRRVI